MQEFQGRVISVKPGARERSLSLECRLSHRLLRGKARPCPPQLTAEERGTDTQDLEKELRGLTVDVQTEDLLGIGRTKWVEIEAGTAEIKRGESPLPPSWEWVWLQDPRTGEWERLWVPKEEANYRRRREIPPQPSYWGEAKAWEW